MPSALSCYTVKGHFKIIFFHRVSSLIFTRAENRPLRRIKREIEMEVNKTEDDVERTVANIRIGIYGFTWIFGLGANFLGSVRMYPVLVVTSSFLFPNSRSAA